MASDMTTDTRKDQAQTGVSESRNNPTDHRMEALRAAADAILQQCIDDYASGYAIQIAEVYAVRGEPDAMFDWLQRALKARDPGMQSLLYDALLLRYRDDPRYAALIRNWGSDAGRQMFLLLQKQALVSIPLALAMLLAAWNPVPFRAGDVLAIVVLAIAIVGEGIADRQLARFRRDKGGQGEICDAGLWAWSRHPNYFFEWLGWVAYPILAIDLGGIHPYGWLALLGPAVMYWLLVHVSGIPPLEAHMVERHGERYRRYQARTSAFFLLPPAKGDR